MTAAVHDHSRWGKGDQLGAGHFLTPQNTLSALRLVQRGESIDMSHEIELGAPRIPPNQTPYLLLTATSSRNNMRHRAALGAKNEVGSNLERIEMTTHVGTHIDALGHFTIGDRMYGGYSADQEVSDRGLVHLGIEHAPSIITRAICLDVSSFDGGAYLDRGRPVTRDDLQRACDRAGAAPQAGDVVCIQTGWGRFFMTDNDRYVSGEPGIDLQAAQWLTAQDVVAIGVDNMAVEVLPGTRHPEEMMPVHQHCLAEAGVYLIENLVMDGVLRAGQTTFCFILLPTKFKGATGCPVRPIALL